MSRPSAPRGYEHKKAAAGEHTSTSRSSHEPTGMTTTITLTPPAEFINANQRELVAEFTVPGEPVSKARARFTGYGSRVRTYTPAKTMQAERAFAAAYRAVAEPNTDPDTAFGVEVEFLHQTGQRRDVDNMLKAVLDGLNGLAWPDDVQVTDLRGTKRRVPKGEAATHVRIYTLGRIEKPRGICEHCGTEFAQYASTGARRFCTRRCGFDHATAKRIKTCLGCGIEFNPHSSVNLYCKRSCASQHKRVTLTCVTCERNYTIAQSLANKGVHACSPECRAKYHAKRRVALAKGTCADCGGPTSTKKYQRCRACHIENIGRWAKTKRITITPLEDS